MKSYKRSDRIQHLLQEEISRLLRLEIKDPRVQFVTITDVKLTPDLQNATIFVTSLGGIGKRDDLLLGLKRATGYIRSQLGRQLKLKFIPSIEFVFDESYDKEERILDLFEQIHHEKQELVEE